MRRDSIVTTTARLEETLEELWELSAERLAEEYPGDVFTSPSSLDEDVDEDDDDEDDDEDDDDDDDEDDDEEWNADE
jgi:hypothetical protein